MKKIKKVILPTIILCAITMVVIWVTNSNVKAKTESVIYTKINDVPKTEISRGNS